MKVAMLVITPRLNKGHLIELVTRIVEGTNMKYITGGGQTKETSRRVKIYERESAVRAIPRPNRRPRTLSPGLPIFSALGIDSDYISRTTEESIDPNLMSAVAAEESAKY